MKVKFHVVVKRTDEPAHGLCPTFHRDVELPHPPIVGVDYSCIEWAAEPQSVSYDIDADLWEAWCGTISVNNVEAESQLLLNEGWIRDQ